MILLSAVPVLFHTFCKENTISFFQAQASASQLNTPAHSLYQELEIILGSSFLSSVAVLFHIFCKDDNISFSQAQASASQFYTPAQSMYQDVEIIFSDSILSAVQYCSIHFAKMTTFLFPKHRLVLVCSIHQHIACTKK